MATKLTGISYQSEHFRKVRGLMSTVTEESLYQQFKRQKWRKAAGVDGVDKRDYEEKLFPKLRNLMGRLKSFSYKPQPVLRVTIPKENGKTRPLGISAFEDRLVQGCFADGLSATYEPRFKDFSYGFRPGRSAHDAVAEINRIIMNCNVNYVLDADIKGFFDNVDQDWLITFLENDIEDKNFIRYIKRFLKAGVMENTEILPSDMGTPQGSLLSPVCANVYLHYVLDWWFDERIRPRLQGEAHIIRYADDFAVLMEYQQDAEWLLERLRVRLGHFGLELSEEKTRIIPFGRWSNTKDEFNFLGFTFYNATTRRGYYRVGIRTSKKKLKAKRAAVKKWLKEHMHDKVKDLMTKLNTKLQGHYQYYGVNGNFKALQGFEYYTKYMVYKTLRRRSQKDKTTWERVYDLWKKYIKPPHITKHIWNWSRKVTLRSRMP